MLNTVLFFFCSVIFLLLLRPTIIAVQLGYLGFMMRGAAVGKETLIAILVLACEVAFFVGAVKFFPFQISWVG